MKKRVGYFICNCGINIAGAADVKKISQELSHCPGIVHSEDFVYMCSDPKKENSYP